jgi:hypothetical protein
VHNLTFSNVPSFQFRLNQAMWRLSIHYSNSDAWYSSCAISVRIRTARSGHDDDYSLVCFDHYESSRPRGRCRKSPLGGAHRASSQQLNTALGSDRRRGP